MYACFLSFAAYSQKNPSNSEFKVKGKIDEKYNGIVIYLSYVNSNGKYIIDSAMIKNKSFTFKGQVNYFYYAKLQFKKASTKYAALNSNLDEFVFGLENKLIYITLYDRKKNQIVISGNITQQKIDKFYKKSATFYIKSINRFDTLKFLDQKDSIKFLQICNLYKKEILKFHSNNFSDNATSFLLFENRKYFDDSEFVSLFHNLTTQQAESYYGKFISRILERKKLKNSQVGIEVNNIVSIDIKGDTISLYDKTKNGYVLLDFWASWCNPCRTANPFLRAIFNKYNKAGFDLIGISCDKVEDEPKWKKAVEQDSISQWAQILTTPPNSTKIINRPDLLTEYKITSFPTYILIDKNNIIIARFDNEKEIQEKLIEIYGK